MKLVLIAVVVLAVVIAGFIFAAGPEPHIVIPGEILWKVGPLNLTSTLLGAWLAMFVIIVLALAATRSLKLVPSGLQNLVEGLIEFLLGQVEEIAGRENGRRFFMVVATFFLFILVGNWLSLLPFYKTIGITKDYGHEIFHEMQEKQEEGKSFDDKKHFLAWEMEDAGGIGLANTGAKTFKFDIHEGEAPGDALDRYIIELAEFYTDYELPEGHDIEEGHADPADVRAAFAALEADPDAPKFLTAAELGGEAHGQAPKDSPALTAKVAAETGVPSPALGEEFVALDFPGKKIALVYPFFRASFSDLSNTLGLAICAFLIIEFWGFQAQGFRYLGKFFVNPLKSPIMTFVGFLELLSEFIRIISFSFRLFGNIFAGGVLLLILTFLVPFLAPIGIFGLELFVGLIQAIVFSLLVLVFAVGAVEHHGEDEHHDDHGDPHGGAADPHHTPSAVQAH